MKKILIAGLGILSVTLLKAQQTEGTVTYQRTVQVKIQLMGMSEEMQNMLPKSRTDKFELIFGKNQSLWKAAEPDNEDDNMTDNGGGMVIRTSVMGANDVSYTDIGASRRVESRELMDKKFIIDDSIHPLKWKMTGETKTILNHTCMKAEATQISQRMQMNMNNGNMERKEVADTAKIIAWFANDIPVSAGPAEYQGQLPGLILEMDVSNGRQVYQALSISPKADLASIKEPAGKKHYTQEEFRKERDKMMQEMQRNNGGGQRVFRMN
jgi:GLPGLI family protein